MEGKSKLMLSASSLATFQSCRKRYEYEKIRGIYPNERPVALDFGTAMHRGLERVFRGVREFQETTPEPDWCKWLCQVGEDAELSSRTVDLSESDRIKVEVLLDRYTTKYACSDAFGDNRLRVIDVEHSMAQPLIGPNGRKALRYGVHGIADAVVECTDGEVAIVEHKTVAAITEQYCDRVEIDTQVLLYAYMLTLELGKPVRRVIYDIIQKPRHEMAVGETDGEFEARKAAAKCPERCRRKFAEEPHEFRQRLADAIDDGYFMRHVVEIDGETMDEFKKDIWEMVHDVGECDRYYRQTCNCLKFGSCPYMDLCRNHGRIEGLEGQYHTANKED